jgi:squalene synthase HpnC
LLNSLLASTPHYENFPVGSWLVPQALRPAYASIYRFARYADDIADEGDLSDEERLSELGALEKSIRGEANHPIAVQVMPYVAQHRLNATCFLRLLSAFKQDVEKKRYANLKELLQYCEGSANPVGELVLGLFASASGRTLTSPAHLEKSDQICAALQLINFLQDVQIDVYIPQDLASEHGLSASDLEAVVAKANLDHGIASDSQGQALRQTIAAFHAQTQALLTSGRPLIHMVPLRLGLELRAICSGGQRILDKLAKNQYDPFAHRPKLGTADVPSLLRLFFKACPTSP